MISNFRFSLRGLLTLTAWIAFGLMLIMVPWIWWGVLYPLLVSSLAVFVISRFDVSHVRGQMFWLSTLVGGLVYLFMVLVIGRLGWDTDRDLWVDLLFRPAFHFLHPNNKYWPWQAFVMAMHIVSAFTFVILPASLAQLVAIRRQFPHSVDSAHEPLHDGPTR
jgi:hypothetical protein